MKSPAGHTRPVLKKKQVRLDLRRAVPPPPPEDEIASRRKSTFWKWFAIVAIFHFLLLSFVSLFYYFHPAPVPPVQFISLVPQGETVKGTPGQQSAPKVGASTPAPAAHHHAKVTPPQPVTPPPPPPAAVHTPSPPTPAPVHPKPVVHEENAPVVAEAKPKPTKPAPPTKKIKVDLHLADAPTTEKTAKPKHVKKTPPPASASEADRDADSSENNGLSKEQIAKQLGKKLAAAGVTNAIRTGVSGAADGHSNPFADFYASIHDQVMNKWQEPNQDDLQAVDPIVQIHVEKNGRVPPGQVLLLRGSGNPAIDDSALGAARGMGYTLQPLPDGCPPDISITFKLTH